MGATGDDSQRTYIYTYKYDAIRVDVIYDCIECIPEIYMWAWVEIVQYH